MLKSGVNRVLAAEGVSNFGSMLSRLTIPWIAALLLQAQPAQMALLLVADVLAAALGALLLGAWVDRSDKRRVMLLADLLRAALLLLLAVAAWHDVVSFPMLLLVAAAGGVLAMAFELARSAWMARHLQHDELARRNAQMVTVGSVSETAAFAIGGFLYQALGAAWSLVLDALSYLASAWCLRGIRSDSSAAAVQQPSPLAGQAVSTSRKGTVRRTVAAVGQSLALVLEHPRLRALACIEAWGSMAFALTGTVYTLYVTRELGMQTSALGLIAALGGAGAVVGAWSAARLAARVGRAHAMSLGLVAFALGLACLPLASGATWSVVMLLVLHQIVGDAGQVLFEVHDRTLRQTVVDVGSVARADAGIRTVGHLALLGGAGLGAWVAEAWGYRAVLWLAVSCACCAALVAHQRLREAEPLHLLEPD